MRAEPQWSGGTWPGVTCRVTLSPRRAAVRPAAIVRATRKACRLASPASSPKGACLARRVHGRQSRDPNAPPRRAAQALARIPPRGGRHRRRGRRAGRPPRRRASCARPWPASTRSGSTCSSSPPPRTGGVPRATVRAEVLRGVLHTSMATSPASTAPWAGSSFTSTVRPICPHNTVLLVGDNSFSPAAPQTRRPRRARPATHLPTGWARTPARSHGGRRRGHLGERG